MDSLVYDNNILSAGTEVGTMKICGLQKLAMVDYPGKLAATVFTGGCNLRCPFCHNALLVTRVEENEVLSQDAVLAFLKSRRGLLDGVVLSGGEPLMQPGVPDFLRAVKDLGFDAGLVDYAAMDIKNSPEKYPLTVGVPGFDMAPIRESAALLMEGPVPFEFRTTVVREFHTAADMEAIGQWLEGAPRYFLQQFVDSGDLVGSGLTAWPPETLRSLADAARPFFGEVAIRGI